jgi:hypothetical protein
MVGCTIYGQRLGKKALLPQWMPWIRKRYALSLPEDGEATFRHQCPTDGPAAVGAQAATAAEDLRSHPTRNPKTSE